MSYAASFSPDYTAARARFRSSALALDCTLEEHSIDERGPDGEDLTIDLARLGSDMPKKIVLVSSGLHGVEGFMGSAIQAALLEQQLGGWKPPAGCALLFIHALNPYGFAWIRRVNEENVDLNRNFLLADQTYEGAPEAYADLDGLFNPRRRPNNLEPFKLKAVYTILRHGMTALKNILPVGQYEYPQGLFFGGAGPSKTMRVLERNLARWIGGSKNILHLDLHSGLGRSATYKLFPNRPADHPRAQWMEQVFGSDVVEQWDPSGVSYTIRGGLGEWCAHQFPDRNYDQLTAEFGTYHVIRVVEALRRENMAHHFCDRTDPATDRAKAFLRETFSPSETVWREAVVERGVALVEKAIEACFEER